MAHAGERVQFDRPTSSFQLTQEKLANMAIEPSTCTLLALHLGRLKDQGDLRSEQVSFGKLNTRAALESSRTARTVP